MGIINENPLLLLVLIYGLIFFNFKRFAQVLFDSAIKAGRNKLKAKIIAYSPMVLFPVLPLIPILGFKALLGSSEYMWLVSIVCIVFTYAPYFIFLFWYCNVSKEDIEKINH